VFDGYSTNISELYATQQDAIHEVQRELILILLLWLQYLSTSVLVLWEHTTKHLQASYQLLIDRQSEAGASQSARTMAAPMPIGLGTTSNMV
jgi:hypothetical protein